MGRKKKNSEALEELVKSNFLKSLKEEYIRHLTAHNIHGTVESTVILNVFKNGTVKYEEKDKKSHRVLELENPSDISKYKGVNPATLRMYRILYSACSRAEDELAPKGLAEKGYKVTINVSKDVWKNYHMSIRLRYDGEKLDRS